MAGPMPQPGGTGGSDPSARPRVDAAGAASRRGQPTGYPRYSPRQHQALLKAGQLIVEWAVEVARYEADLDWQWVHGSNEDPVVTASALARLLHDTRSVMERAEALLMATLSDEST